MGVEQKVVYSPLGIRKEHSGINLLALSLMVWISEKNAKKEQLVVTGSPIPDKGPAIFTGNHIGSVDAFRMFYIGRNFVRTTDGRKAPGRLIIAAAKHTLLSPFEDESEEILKETGKTDWSNSKKLSDKLFKRLPTAIIMHGTGFVPIHRGEADISASNKLTSALSNGGLVAIPLIPTRIPDGTIRNIKRGAVLLAMQHPEVPVYCVATSKEPNIVTIGPPITYAQILKGRGRINARTLAMFFADRTMSIAIPSVQADWKLNRETERQKLYEKKKKDPS